jgi:carboxymethylenebutenolidase
VVDTIEIVMDGGTSEAYVARPQVEGGPEGPYPGVLFFIDAIGLRPRIAEMAQRIADWGYVVLAPNLLWRSGSAAETSPDGDLREEGTREAFMETAVERVRALTSDLATADIPLYLAALRDLDGVDAGPVGATGYCMGARFAVRAAGLDDDVAAVAGFHGGGLVTDADDSPHLALATSDAEFYFGHADQDRSMPPEAVEALGRALEEAGLAATNEVYAGAGHGYSMADTSAYDEAATERSFRELEELLDRTL